MHDHLNAVSELASFLRKRYANINTFAIVEAGDKMVLMKPGESLILYPRFGYSSAKWTDLEPMILQCDEFVEHCEKKCGTCGQTVGAIK